MGEAAVQRSGARAEQLQFLRFLAFFNIYMFHTESWVIFPLRMSHLGSASVSFFFILSGLVTGYSGYGKEVKLTLRDHRQYMMRKLRKVYPLYFLTTLLAVTYSGIPEAVIHMDPEKLRTPLTYLVKNLLLIQSWFPRDSMSYNGAAWFLSTLLFLNTLNPPLLFGLNKVRKSRWKYVFYLFASLGLTAVTVVFCYMTQEWKMGYWHYRFPPARIGEYVCGMMLGFLIRDLQPRLKPKPALTWAFTALEVFGLVFWVLSLPHAGNYWRNHIISWLKPNMLLLAVFGFGMGWVSRLFRCRPLVALGNLGFECFLIHMIVVNGFTFLNPGAADSVAGKVFAFVFCLTVTLVLAVMLRKEQKK